MEVEWSCYGGGQVEGEWSCYRGGHFNGVGEWSCYRGGQYILPLNQGRMVIIKTWR